MRVLRTAAATFGYLMLWIVTVASAIAFFVFLVSLMKGVWPWWLLVGDIVVFIGAVSLIVGIHEHTPAGPTPSPNDGL